MAQLATPSRDHVPARVQPDVTSGSYCRGQELLPFTPHTGSYADGQTTFSLRTRRVGRYSTGQETLHGTHRVGSFADGVTAVPLR